MIALPKAMSQGSNAAGGGALTAFTGKSAARAEPETIASAVANKTIFFMTIPTRFKDQSDSGVPPGTADNRLQRTRPRLWNASPLQRKQKRQAFAAFLGVMPILTNVVGVCCIPITTLTDSCARCRAFGVLGWPNARFSRLSANQLAGHPGVSSTKKAAATDRCGLETSPKMIGRVRLLVVFAARGRRALCRMTP